MTTARLRSKALLPVGCVAVAFAAALGLAAAASPASRDSAAPSRTLTVGVQTPTQVLPIAVGLRHGFFKKAGITGIKFTLFGTLPPMFTAVAQGQIDLATQTPGVLVGYNRATDGTKLKFIAGDAIRSPVWATRNDSNVPVATKADWKPTVLAWKGKKLGLPAPGGFSDLVTKWLLKQVGLTTDDVTLSYVGGNASTALENGLIDVGAGDAAVASVLTAHKSGRAVIAAQLGTGPQEFQDILNTGWITSDESLRKDRALYLAFTQGLVRTRAFMRNPKNKSDIIDILVRKIGLEPDVARAFYQFGVPQTKDTVLNRQVHEKTMQALLAFGVLTGTTPAYSDLVADFAR